MDRGLWEGFLGTAREFPDRPAVFSDRQILTYAELGELARRIAATIQSHAESASTHLAAVLAYRTPVAFGGVLGALLAGHGYVPLNRTFPLRRTQTMFERSNCRVLIVDSPSLSEVSGLLDQTSESIVVLLPDVQSAHQYAERWPRHTFVDMHSLAPAASWRPPEVRSSDIAYLLFTSGSTGVPKGVGITHRNITSFLDYMVGHLEITPEDRLSQTFDMTFDLSVFDMFVAWERGALVCCPPRKTLMKPGRFIRDMQLTVWFSVPSIAIFMHQLGSLRADSFPSLRLSLFCGEPLPLITARVWSNAAPNSILENLYGPTELTISCTLYRFDATRTPVEAEQEIVPIGWPHPGMDALILDQELRPVPPGEPGELVMTGPQMAPGYWKEPEKTAAAFVVPAGRSQTYYRTGDQVRQRTPGGPMTHLGRLDSQVKVLGHRVELGEVEAVVRRVCDLGGVVALGSPKTPSGYGGIEIFIEGDPLAQESLREAVASELPDYMVPNRFHFLSRLPRNVNDKFDRGALARLLEAGQ
jgi:amino acid adenylation domain-containing protein